ncbi:hypothetical protein DEO72_LG8g1309 [Vigna unguiculata]|uniref:Uncharacterized protein n=1 Tax=Vigna unguiculata TaxID=3917 RepID=A0A4D6MTT5_VIGUN|nr:hypothetical protein DEO72_LG8g1309 [Vigna unguiculata]
MGGHSPPRCRYYRNRQAFETTGKTIPNFVVGEEVRGSEMVEIGEEEESKISVIVAGDQGIV